MNLSEYATFYRGFGWNPLPSKAIEKRIFPPWRYGHARDNGLSAASFDKIANNMGCDCIQIALGGPGRLVVLDLDGREAIRRWEARASQRGVQATWEVAHSDNGRHLWFDLPEGETLDYKRVLWKHETDKHSAIELLGRGLLIVAPPSVSPRSGKPYRFLPGHTPDDIKSPAPLPKWLLAMKDVTKKELVECSTATVEPAVVTERPLLPLDGHYDWEDVLPSIPDKLSLAKSWGLRIANEQPNAAGWIRCHAIDRKDRHPSAGFNPQMGIYAETGRGSLRLGQLAVALGVYRSPAECIDDLGNQYLRRSRAR